MVGGVVVAFIGLALHLAKLDYMLGSLSAQMVAYLVIGLGAAIFVIDLVRTVSRTNARKARSRSQAQAGAQANTVKREV